MKLATNIIAVGLALAGALSAAPSQAQNARSYVSGLGSDTNTCSITAPCKTFQGALALTNTGGQIIVLDSGGYGGGNTVNITKAISIINQGGFAGVSIPTGGGYGIVIAAQSGAVSLSGLTIDGFGSSGIGIQVTSAASVTIENCVIRNITYGDGIDYVSTNATSALLVANTLLENNAIGIDFEPTGSATAVFNRVEANNNTGTGIYVGGNNSAATNTIKATASESVAARGGVYGFYAYSLSGTAPVDLMVSHSVASNNGTGVYAVGSGATLFLANSTVTGNTNGWMTSGGGVVDSYGDNYIDGNPNNSGAPPKIPPK